MEMLYNFFTHVFVPKPVPTFGRHAPSRFAPVLFLLMITGHALPVRFVMFKQSGASFI
ncbi:hypothetical protein CES86_0296 [Brucella lupini]|uniref:Uncharacterized protein n=1 Tax=Brucella lupini TaxID=255457 RepID=A0A256GZB7_9HYPH|nr:hypothetical protein CES86_0296 [Brucella lupini]